MSMRLSWRKRLVFIPAVSFVSLLAALALAEVAFRALYPDDGPAAATIVRLQDYLRGDRHELFVGHPFVSHVNSPRPGINSLGFEDREHPREKPPGVIRIACVGGSTTASYAWEFESVLILASADRVEVMNFGMPSWTTAESLVNLALTAQDFKPDVLIIQHAVNDTAPRLYPGFRSDYSHWRLPFRRRFGGLDAFLARHSQLYAYWLWTRGLREFDLKACQARLLGNNAATGPDGGPLPETAIAFERNIRTMVNLGRSWGARSFLVTMPHRTPAPHEETLVTAMHDHNKRLRRLATTLGSGLIDLAEVFRDRDDCFQDLVHFKLEKRVDKAAAIAMALWKAGIVRKR